MNKFAKQLQNARSPLVVAFVVTCVMAIITGALISIDLNRVESDSRERSLQFNEALFGRLELITEQAESTTKAIAIYIDTAKTDFSRPEDQAFLDGLASAMPMWNNISIAPKNCISNVSPVKGNESAIGYCLNSNPQEWSDISRVVEMKKARLLGPYQLAQQGIGYILHRPVFLADGSYWGLVSAVIRQSELIKPLVDDAEQMGFRFNLSSGDSENTDVVSFYRGLKTTDNVTSTGIFETSRTTFTITSAQVELDFTSVSNISRRMVVISLVAIMSSFLIALQYRNQISVRRTLEEVSRRSPTVLFQARLERDQTLNLEYVSEGSRGLLGIESRDLTLNPKLLADVFSIADLELARVRLAAAKSPGETWSQRFELLNAVGDVRWIQAEATFEKTIGSEPRWNGVFIDATSTVDKEDALALAANAIEVLDQGVAILDANFIIVNINSAITKVTGFEKLDVLGRPYMDFGDGLNDPGLLESIKKALVKSAYWRGQVTHRYKDGTISRGYLTFSAVKKTNGDIAEVVLVMNSTQDSLVDPASGLANRTLFEDYLSQAIQTAQDQGTKVALLHIGVTGVGAVNDSFGHKIGDRMLHEIGERLSPFTATGNCLGRIGDTAFGIYREIGGEFEDIDGLAANIIQSLTQEFVFDDVSVLASVAIGIAEYPDDSLNTEELRSHASQAYKVTLAESGLAISHFSKNLEDSAKARSYLTSYLKEAIEARAIDFHYQPIVNLKTGQITKAEVLARWFDEHLGHVSPARFIPLAENSKLIDALGNQLLDTTLQTLTETKALGKDIQFSVNVSPVEFLASSFVSNKAQSFSQFKGANPSNIVFELTEGILVKRKEQVQAKIQTFKAEGVKFAIDDFGTGYSSLAYLQQLDVDFIKIDKAFIDNIESESGLALCKSIVDLAHGLGLQVIAEGVEKESQARLLRTMGCEFAQGYLFSTPLAKADFLSLLAAN